jgi:uncharacterized protein
LGFGGTLAHAGDLSCGGANIMEAIKLKDSASYQALIDDGAKTLNGASRLWKIEKAGTSTSYLFGTMHLTDPRVIDLTPQAQSAFDSVGTIVIESTEILDPNVAAKALQARPDLMMFTDEKTLSSYLDPTQTDLLDKGLKSRGISLAAVNKMKPWLIAGMVSLPACEAQRKKSGASFLDIKLAKDAAAKAKKVLGLETISEQLDAMASLPMELHINGLLDSLALGATIDDVMETMIVLYTEGKIGTIVPFLKTVSGTDSNSKSYGQLEEAMITARNKTMRDRGLPILEKGSAFIAVGALHLPGEHGLIELLRKQGYAVSAISR